MRAAIYARKSTDDSDRREENKSVTRQVDHGKAYANKNGWTVDDEHVYVDDGFSGAEFKNRPGLIRLLNHLKEFNVIVMSELSRIGRDQIQTAQCLANIEATGVRVFFYLTNEELRFGTAVDRFLVGAVSFAAELEREKASQRARDALERKARFGFNTGGVVYGYDNVPIVGANGVKSHTEYRINQTEAEVVRRIYRCYADGHGMRSIVLAMNGDANHTSLAKRYFDGVRPASPRKGTGSWAPSSVRKILVNERYRGKIPFGRHRKTYRAGTKTRVKQDGDHFIAERSELRIVPEPLWNEVVARFSAVRKTYLRGTNGMLWGRPGMGAESRYLLTGIARCACCGANMKATSRRSGTNNLIRYYECGFWANRGTGVCANNRRIHMEDANSTVLGAIQHSILTPTAIDEVVDRAVQIIVKRQSQRPDARTELETEIERDDRRIQNFLRTIAHGDAPQTVLSEIRRLEEILAVKRAQLERFTAEVPDQTDVKRLRRVAYERIGRFRDLIYADVPLARQALRKLLAGPIECAPDGRLRGETKIGPLLDSIDLALASPRGFEPRLPP